jgi:predicted unusual protein kinase regulating ubiquinone biosynthesis (AarF/ABC1/UbiB family)
MAAVSTFASKIVWDEIMDEKDGSEQVKERARELREQLVKLGPTFVKVSCINLHMTAGCM